MHIGLFQGESSVVMYISNLLNDSTSQLESDIASAISPSNRMYVVQLLNTEDEDDVYEVVEEKSIFNDIVAQSSTVNGQIMSQEEGVRNRETLTFHV